ncbi:hypothetical protein [uncultured Paraglaciecola sp.]|uniref:hypothetical protein n=1 Tax=uncultured Paraglaciecola sp. TaxID=1765024 RepID=UPI0030D91644|tara:strand:+ start:255577 stop:256221 length:645 start_codon:yes stop_codon:yes gene_type:complete
MSASQQHYLVGYGSLLSHDSRSRYSNIFCPNLPIIAHGWRREWLARGLEDLQTCLGVSQDTSAHLNGVLLPIEQISPELRNREQDYQFIEVDPNNIEAVEASPLVQAELDKIFANPDSHKIWICANQHKEPANIHYPIYQTYLDTCLVGCFEIGIDNFASEFIQNTHFWEHGWINDRSNSRYIRAALVNQEQQQQIDQLLASLQVLKYRKETSQ